MWRYVDLTILPSHNKSSDPILTLRNTWRGLIGQGKQAKTLRKAELQRLLNHVSHSRHPERDRVVVLLSFKAGLRAKEIAQLTWSMVMDTTGELADVISLHNKASKGRAGGRTIPLHRELADALLALKTVRGDRVRPDRPVIYSERAPGYSPNAVAIWFHTREIGLEGASSHSGQKDVHYCHREKDHRSRWIASRRPGDGGTFLAFDDAAIYPRRQCGKTKRYRAHLIIKPRCGTGRRQNRSHQVPGHPTLPMVGRELVGNRTA